MRAFLFVLTALSVMGLAFWAYQENYRAKEVRREAANLRREIGLLHEKIGVLTAEWAYLNRPGRLRELVLINFDRVPLLPLEPEQFGAVREVAWPLPAELFAPEAGEGLAPEDLAQRELAP